MPMPRIWQPNHEICEWLREKYEYEPSIGRFTLRRHLTAVRLVVASNGYHMVRLTNTALGVRRYVSAHRLAWFLHHGAFPLHEIDHIDRVKTNNRLSNLREATRSNNHGNGPKKVRRDGKAFTSQFRGVSWNKSDRRWVAMIRVGGKTKYLGQSQSEAEAARLYNAAAREVFGEYANLNRLPYERT